MIGGSYHSGEGGGGLALFLRRLPPPGLATKGFSGV